MKATFAHVSLFSVLLIQIILIACTDEPRDTITVRVFSYYESFSGSYTVDGENPVSISANSSYNVGGKILYYSEYALGEIDSLSVSVTTSASADFLAIRVYKDGARVKEAAGSSVASLSLTYDYDE
jgi:hypothetical protein